VVRLKPRGARPDGRVHDPHHGDRDMSTGGRHYLPRADSPLETWAENLYTFLDAHAPEVGLTPDDAVAVKDAWVAYAAALAAHTAAAAAARSAKEAKDAARAVLEETVRPRIKVAQAFPGTTDGARGEMAVAVPARPRRHIPAPTTTPSAKVDHSLRLRHTLHITDGAAPGRRARPRGSIGAEVRYTLRAHGEPPPVDPDTMRPLALATSGEATAEFTGADAGRRAVYIMRWLGARGAPGPWSELISATVAA
jgi:hypothetical protein